MCVCFFFFFFFFFFFLGGIGSDSRSGVESDLLACALIALTHVGVSTHRREAESASCITGDAHLVHSAFQERASIPSRNLFSYFVQRERENSEIPSIYHPQFAVLLHLRLFGMFTPLSPLLSP
jgi:hypothetical protein